MKKALIITGLALACAPLASAEKHTIEYAVEGRDTVTVTYDSDTMTLSVGDVTVPFTVNEEKGEVCSEGPDGTPVCASFESDLRGADIGTSVNFTATNGDAGTATLVAVE